MEKIKPNQFEIELMYHRLFRVWKFLHKQFVIRSNLISKEFHTDWVCEVKYNYKINYFNPLTYFYLIIWLSLFFIGPILSIFVRQSIFEIWKEIPEIFTVFSRKRSDTYTPWKTTGFWNKK